MKDKSKSNSYLSLPEKEEHKMLLENLMSEKEVKTKECKEAQECEEAQDQGGARTKFGSCCFSRYVIMIVQCSWNIKIVY